MVAWNIIKALNKESLINVLRMQLLQDLQLLQFVLILSSLTIITNEVISQAFREL